MPVVEASKAIDHVCPFYPPTRCVGPKCMAWQWHGPTHEVTHANPALQHIPPAGNSPWVKHGKPYTDLSGNRTQAWRREIEQKQGFFGRVQQTDFPPDELIPF